MKPYLDTDDPFYSINHDHNNEAKPKQQPRQKEIITTKLVVTMVIIAIVKVAVLILWI